MPKSPEQQNPVEGEQEENWRHFSKEELENLPKTLDEYIAAIKSCDSTDPRVWQKYFGVRDNWQAWASGDIKTIMSGLQKTGVFKIDEKHAEYNRSKGRSDYDIDSYQSRYVPTPKEQEADEKMDMDFPLTTASDGETNDGKYDFRLQLVGIKNHPELIEPVKRAILTVCEFMRDNKIKSQFWPTYSVDNKPGPFIYEPEKEE